MTKRLRNIQTGAVVQVRDDKTLGSEWVPVEVPAELKRSPGRPKKSE